MSEFPFKPELGFYQQDFDGTQPEISEEERLQVASNFELMIDRMHDEASRENPASINFDKGWQIDKREFSDLLIMQDPNGYHVAIDATKDEVGRLMHRSITIFWSNNGQYGTTDYRIEYDSPSPAVCRKDELDGLPEGIDPPEEVRRESWRQSQEAAALAEEHGFNNQPISKQELDDLAQYVRELRYLPRGEDS